MEGISIYWMYKDRPDNYNYWCVVKDEMAPKGFRRVNSLESCPREKGITDVKISPKEIIEKLKTYPEVYNR